MMMSGCRSSRAFVVRVPAGEPATIAHRGASGSAPENTMASFRLAEAMGAHYIELDCTLSADSEVVVIHDGSVDRTTDGRGNVRALTSDQLRQLDAGSWYGDRFAGERIPTLDKVLAWANGRMGVYIEIKSMGGDEAIWKRTLDVIPAHEKIVPDWEPMVMAWLEDANSQNLALTRQVYALIVKNQVESQIVVQTFDPFICFAMRSLSPRIRVELLACENPDDPESWSMIERWIELVEPDGVNLCKDSLNGERLAAFQRSGKTVSVWTVDTEEDLSKVQALGVNGIITNHPERLTGIELAQENQ